MRYIILLLLISFASCTRTYKTQNPSFDTFCIILQKSLESDVLNPYIKESSGKEKIPIYVVFSEGFWDKPYPNIKIEGTSIRFLSKSEADSAGILSYYWITDYITVDSTARIMLANPKKNLLFGVSLDQVNGSWIIESTFKDSLN